MKMNFFHAVLLSLICCMPLSSLFSQDLVYKPKNPAFGGETFNYQWLLNSAQVQDDTEDEEAVIRSTQGSSLDNFAESLNRQLLSQLSRQLVSNQFGENGLEDGSYTIGDFQVEVSSTIEGLSVTILDTSVGDQTQIVIPYY